MYTYSFALSSSLCKLSFLEEVGLCPEPGGVLHARRSGALFPYQLHDQMMIYMYTCDLCYPGGGTITCVSSGEWSWNDPCEYSATHIHLLASQIMSNKAEHFADKFQKICLSSQSRDALAQRTIFQNFNVIIFHLGCVLCHLNAFCQHWEHDWMKSSVS